MNNLFLTKILSFAYAIIPFILALTIIVFVHELGHFLIARYHGVHVTTFSIGYGKELFGWTDRKGTRWRFSMIPLGGYVMMLGDADATSVRADLTQVEQERLHQTLPSKTPWQRLMVASGGPLMNVVFTLAVFILVGLWKGIPDMEPRIQSVVESSVASKGGLTAGDLITGINNEKIHTVTDMKKLLKRYKGQDITLHYRRNNQELSSPLALYNLESDGKKIPVEMLGVALQGELLFTKASFVEAIRYGGMYCYSSTVSILSGLSKAITGKKDGAKFGSILSIGDIANQSMAHGLISFLNFMAMLSFSLAIFNLLPIPVLDGGSIVLNLIEGIRGEPLSERLINIVYTIGIGIIAMIMLIAIWNDFVRYGVVRKVVDLYHTFIK